MERLYRQLFKNVLSSWSVYALRLIIAFFFVPYITFVLGESRYGVWIIVFQIVSYFGLFDLGFAQAVTRFVARAAARLDTTGINRIISTSTVIYTIIGAVTFGLLWAVSHVVFGLFSIDDTALLEEATIAVRFIGGHLAISFVFLPYSNALPGFQRYDIQNGLRLGEEILRVGALVLLLDAGFGLGALAAATVAVTLARCLAGVAIVKRMFPSVALSTQQVNRETGGELFRYSRTAFLVTALWTIIYSSDGLLLGWRLGVAAAGVFAPAAQLIHHVRQIINAAGAPLMPTVSHLDATDARDTIAGVYIKGLRYVSFISFFIALGVVLYAGDFVTLWLPVSFAGAAPAMIILAIGAAVYLPQIIGESILFGVGRHHYLLYVLVFEALMKFALALPLIDRYGINGMALACAVPQVLLYSTVLPYFMSKTINRPLSRLSFESLKGSLAGVVTAAVTMWPLRALMPPVGWPELSFNVAVACLVAVVPLYLLLDTVDRRRLSEFFGRTSDSV